MQSFESMVSKASICLLLVLTCLAAGTVGCGESKGECGNGVIEPKNNEQCDCGNDPNNLPPTCIAPNGATRTTCSSQCTNQQINFTKLVIHWVINGTWESAGSFDNCLDLSADSVHVAISGPYGFFHERFEGCTSYQVSLTETAQMPLHAGTYTADATLLSKGQPVGDPVRVQGMIQLGWTTDLTVDFALESLYGHESFVGDLLIRFQWDGVDCEFASPVVTTEHIYLTDDLGEPLAGFPLSQDCLSYTQVFDDLPTGNAFLRIEGTGDATEVLFCEEVPIRVGIGNNIPYLINVPPVSENHCPP